LELIAAAHTILEEQHPISVRGVAYRLFLDYRLIPDMSLASTQRVSRLLTDARESGDIPWEWIVDETREAERIPSWRDPDAFRATVKRSYRRDHWALQPYRVEVWSEKGTVRGTVSPVLDEFGLDFRVMHGWSSSTVIHNVAEESKVDERWLIILYVGDFDPSGMYMSQVDLPNRLLKYGAVGIDVQRVALVENDLVSLPTFKAKTKKKDPRFKWFTSQHGRDCCEIDALPPNELRERLRASITHYLDPEIWARSVAAEEAEQVSLRSVLDAWNGISIQDAK
jgi:hypothetical protein